MLLELENGLINFDNSMIDPTTKLSFTFGIKHFLIGKVAQEVT